VVIARDAAFPVRYKILALLFLVSLLTFLDRVNISVAGKYINEAYGFSPVQYGIIFSAFVAGYMLFQLSGDYLSDRFGPRAVLTGAILWWSAFTVLTALAGTLVTKAGSATGFMNTLANVGGIISPTPTPLIAEKLGWDSALIFAAALAIAGSLLWIGVTHNAVPHCNGPREL